MYLDNPFCTISVISDMIPWILFLTIIVMAKSEYRSVLYTCTFSNPSKLDQYLLSILYIGPVLHKHILRVQKWTAV